MIDKRDLADLEVEYKALCLADLTDDINCSIGDIKYRANRMAAIEDEVSSHIANEWFSEVEKQAESMGYASGKIFGKNH